VNPNAFPAGSYWLTLRVGDLKLKKRGTYFKLKEDKQQLVDLDVKKNKKRIVISDMQSLDPMIRSILRARGSKVDAKHLIDWLESETPRPRRKACLLNVLAKLRTVPSEDDSLISEIKAVFFVGTDRIYVRAGKGLHDRLAHLSEQPSKPFYYEGSPASSRHRELLGINPPVPKTKDFDLHSYRHEKDPSLQIVIAEPCDHLGSYYADLDLDRGNPLRDLVGAFTHLGELINPGETDHLDLYKALAKGGAGKYLGYKLERT
jgi:hypothetical protein